MDMGNTIIKIHQDSKVSSFVGSGVERDHTTQSKW